MANNVQLDIGGMHCAACSTRIEKVVGKLDGVESCSVNLATAKASITSNPELVSIESIREAIGRLGFTTEEVNSAGGGQTKEDAEQELLLIKRRLIPAFILALCIMLVSMGPMVGIPLPSVIAPNSSPLVYALLQFVLVLPVIYLGRNFYTSGVPSLFRGIPNMDSLIAIGTGAAVLYSTWNLVEIMLGIDPVAKAHDLYFESAAMLIALISLGKYLEMRSKVKTGDAIASLMQLAPDKAIVVGENGERKEVRVESLQVGDTILIKPGERIPVDGEVVRGSSAVDESMLTGESVPVQKNEGDSLFGGTLNTTGTLTFAATKVGGDTTLARIVSLVQDAQGSKAPIARLADRISLYFVPVVICIALVAGLSWYFLGGADFSYSLRIFIAVMVIACPCAMGLATPTSIMVGTGRGAQLGVLVKTGEVLERAQGTTCIVFDKTGTLTLGKPAVTDIISCADFNQEKILRFAAGMEQLSEHPLAAAVLRAAKEKQVVPENVEDFLAVPGLGLKANVREDKNVIDLLLGNREFIAGHIKSLPPETERKAEELAGRGKTVLYFAADGKLQGMLAIADPLKDDVQTVVPRLKSLGIKVVMLTGDNEKTAHAVAAAAGIEQVIAGVLPEGKAEEIKKLQQAGELVAMVGDGINDAPALVLADVGIAMGSGIDVAMESADIVLMNSSLQGVENALGLSRATMKNIHQNLFWAFAYNIVGIPVAAGVLAAFGGPSLNPMIGGAAMAMSSVSVVTNALRLRNYKPEVQ